MPLGHTLLRDNTLGKERPLVRHSHRVFALGSEHAQFGHLGDNHRHDLKAVNLVIRVSPCRLVLYNQNPQHIANTLDRHTKERCVHLLAGFGHKPETLGRRRIIRLERRGCISNPPNKPLPNAQPRPVNGLGVQTFS